MKTVLSVLASIITVLIVTTEATVQVFSEDAVEALRLTRQGPARMKAKLINPQVEVELRKQQSDHEAILLLDGETIPNEELAEEHGHCGIHNGIEISYGANTDVFCKFVLLTMRIVYPEVFDPNTYVRISLVFEPTNLENCLVMQVPVFKLPQDVATRNSNEQKIWANNARVGLVSPFHEQQIEDVLQDKPIKHQLGWLKQLLSYGLNLTALDDNFDDNVVMRLTRPLVLPESLVDNIEENIEQYVNGWVEVVEAA